MVDEESKLPNTSDKTLLDKLNARFAEGRHSRYATQLKTPQLFTIKHYAGNVVYAVEGFLEKSIDNISADLIAALKASTAPVVAALFSVGGKGGAAAGGKSRKPTVGAMFAKELSSLVELIESTSSHFIRCVKPNSSRSATEFELQSVLEQLTYSGVFEAVQVHCSSTPLIAQCLTQSRLASADADPQEGLPVPPVAHPLLPPLQPSAKHCGGARGSRQRLVANARQQRGRADAGQV